MNEIMKIAYIVPGTGGAFYCENCIRDCAMIAGLRELGHEVAAVPMYLPLIHEENVDLGDTAPFFGAVRTWLQYHVPLLKVVPSRLLRMLDSPSMLAFAASKAATTRAAGHEGMTIAMLKGLEGPLAGEFERMVRWIRTEVKPDVVFLSNAFLLGVAQAFKSLSRVPVVCLVQDEHTWVDAGAPDRQSITWAEIAGQSRHADALLSFSTWYADHVGKCAGLALGNVTTIPFGVDFRRYTRAPKSARHIGFLSRLCRDLGLRVIADAYAIIQSGSSGERDLKLCGGYTRDDHDEVTRVLAGSRAGWAAEVVPEFGRHARARFLSGLAVLAVPSPIEIALGTFLFESLAAGVPVVQPDHGGFSEVIRETEGGLLYSPNTSEALADALERLLKDDSLRRKCSKKGRAAIADKFNHLKMAESAVAVCR